jgi:hypothetical protein
MKPALKNDESSVLKLAQSSIIKILLVDKKFEVVLKINLM